MAGRLAKWIAFIRGIAGDDRIPARNKAILGVMVASLLTPIDLIPDFIPVLGYFDDVIVIMLVLDYIFNEIPDEVLADHYTGDAATLRRMRRRTRIVGAVIPKWIRRRIWA